METSINEFGFRFSPSENEGSVTGPIPQHYPVVSRRSSTQRELRQAVEFDQVRSQFSEKELVDLSWAVTYINGWNRMSIAFRGQPEVPDDLLANKI